MLDRLRQGAQGWVSKTLLILLVISFAIWGISGELSGYGAGTLATVGDQEVTVPEFARRNERYQQVGRQIPPEDVLQQLIGEAALEDQAHRANLGVSDDWVAKQIAADPTFQNEAGSFDRDRFLALLSNARIDRDDYVRDLRQQAIRGQISTAAAAGVTVPQPVIEALYRFQNEERTISFMEIDESAIPPVAPPDEPTLQAYFEANKQQFRAPEYRRLGLLTLDPAGLAKSETVTQEDVAAEYERRRAGYTRPERRRIEQIRFESREAAEQALTTLAGGHDLAPLAQSRNLQPAELDQGLKTQAEFLDQAVAQAAFAAQPDVVVPVIEGALEPSLIKVTAVEPGSVTPLEEVAPRLREEMALRNARDALQDLYDRIEDERAGGASLAEVAAAVSVPFRQVDAVAADGTAPDGSRVDLAASQELISAAFQSDVGVENDPIRTGASEGFIFFEVLEVIPERDRTLDEARAAVTAAWHAQEVARRIDERAQAGLDRLRKGEPLPAIAAEFGRPVQVAEAIKRGARASGLSANAAAQAFAGPEGHVANAEADTPPARILLKVDRVTAPPFFAEAANVAELRTQLAGALSNDILSSFNRQILDGRDWTINNATFTQLTGTPNPQ